jgi:hypothetical protein
MTAEDPVSSMLLCPPSLLFRLAESPPLSHCATPYSKSEKDNHGPGFSGLLHCLRDCSPRYDSLYRNPNLFHCTSSAVARACLHFFERRHFCFERLQVALSAAKLGARVGDAKRKACPGGICLDDFLIE